MVSAVEMKINPKKRVFLALVLFSARFSNMLWQLPVSVMLNMLCVNVVFLWHWNWNIRL